MRWRCFKLQGSLLSLYQTELDHCQLMCVDANLPLRAHVISRARDVFTAAPVV